MWGKGRGGGKRLRKKERGRRGADGMLQGSPRLGTAKQEVASGGPRAATHLLKVGDKGGFSENPLALQVFQGENKIALVLYNFML
jgi:hypothetical protein